MGIYITKLIISAVIIVAVSEIAKVHSWLAAFITSLPVVSILAISWLYIDTQNIEKVVDLSTGIFWLVIPSLVFFIALPILLKYHVPFWWSLFLACSITAACYGVYALLLTKTGIIR